MYDEDIILPFSLQFDDSGDATNLGELKNYVKTINDIFTKGTKGTTAYLKNLSKYPEEVRAAINGMRSELASAQRDISYWSKQIESNQKILKDPKFLGSFFDSDTQISELKRTLVSQQASLQMAIDKYYEYADAIRTAWDSADASLNGVAQSSESMADAWEQQVQAVNDEAESYTNLSDRIREAYRLTRILEEETKVLGQEDTSGLAGKYKEYQDISRNIANILSGKFKEDRENAKALTNDVKILAAELKRTMGEVTDPESRKALKAQIKALLDLSKKAKAVNENSFGGNVMNRQTYYNLRQIRLLGSEFDRINKNIKNVSKGFVNSLKNMSKALITLALGFTNLRKSTEKATKANKTFHKGLSGNLWTLLRYTIGIRSLFALTNRLRTALSQGMQNLALYSNHVNQQMSSLVTSLLLMKNAITAAAQPFLNILAPALEATSARVNELSFNIAQLIASLTGQSFVYKAKRAQVDYAASLNKSADAAEKLNDALGQYDKLEVISKDKDTGKDVPDPSEMFETITPINAMFEDWAKRLKNLAKLFFDPLKKAWDKKGQYVMDSWKYALDEVWGLIRDIGRDFLKMWNEEETIKIFEDILQIIGDIGQTIGNIASNIRDAWNEDNLGLKIWEDLRDITGIVVDHLKEVSNYAVDWSKDLDFKPLLTSLEELLDALKPVADFIGGVFEDIMKDYVLNYIKFLIEEGFPGILKSIKDVTKAIKWNKLRNNLKKITTALEKLSENVVKGLAGAIKNVGKQLGKFTSSKEFSTFMDNVAKFISKINAALVEKVFTAIGQAILTIASAIMKFVNSKPFQTFIDWLFDKFNKASADKIANAIVAITSALLTFKGITTVIPILKNLYSTVTIFKGFLSTMSGAPAILKGIGTGFGVIGAAAIDVLGTADATSRLFDSLKSGEATIGTFIGSIGEMVGSIGFAGIEFSKVFGVPAGIIIAAIGSYVGMAIGLFKSMDEVIVETMNEEVFDSFMTGSEEATTTLEDLTARVQTATANATQGMEDMHNKALGVQDAKQAFEDAATGVNTLNIAIENADSISGAAFDDLQEAVKNLGETYKEYISQHYDYIISQLMADMQWAQSQGTLTKQQEEYYKQQIKSFTDAKYNAVENASVVSEKVSGLAADYQTAVTEFGEGSKQATEAWDSYYGALTGMYESFNLSTEASDETSQSLKEHSEQIKSITGDLKLTGDDLQEIAQNTGEALAGMSTTMGDAWDTINTDLKDFQNEVSQTYEEGSTEWENMVQSHTETLAQKMQGPIQAYTENVNYLQEQFAQKGKQIIQDAIEEYETKSPIEKTMLSLFHGVPNAEAYAQKQFKNFADNAINGEDGLANSIVKAGEDAGVKVDPWIDDFVDNINSKLYQERIKASQASKSGQSYKMSENWTKTYDSEIKKTSNSVNTKPIEVVGENINKDLQDSINKSINLDPMKKKLEKGMGDLGKDSMNGMSKSMIDESKKFDYANTIATNTIERLRSKGEFDTHSPSKKTIPIGEDLFQGIIVGFTSMFAEFDKVSSAFVDKSIGAMSKQIQMNFVEMNSAIVKSWDMMKKTSVESVNAMRNAIMKSADDIKRSWADTFNQLGNPTVRVFQSMANGIRGPLNAIISGVERMVNGIIFAFNNLSDVLNHMHFEIPDWVPYMGGNSFYMNMPKYSGIRIPRLAQGAVIPPNKEFMAMLGDQKQGMNIETPLDTMIEAFKTALAEEGGSNHEPIVLQLDGKTVAKVVWEETDKKYKQTGKYVPSYV